MAKSVVINDRTHEAVAKVRKLTQEGRQEFVEIAVENAKEKSPYLTGNHRDLISHDEIDGGTKARIFSQSNYGAHLELGTSRMSPRPHFAPAIDATVKEFNDGKKWS